MLQTTGTAALLALAGCSGGGGDDGGETESAEAVTTAGGDGEDGCTPGHTAGDSPCQQVADDARNLVAFDASGTDSLVTFEYPCGWERSGTDAVEDLTVLNVERSEFGPDGEANALVQVHQFGEPVDSTFIETKGAEGSYDEVEYEYDGETRTGLVTAESLAGAGTLGHVVVPHDGEFIHVRFASSLAVESCEISPRPDHGLVKAMVQSVGANPDSTFELA